MTSTHGVVALYLILAWAMVALAIRAAQDRYPEMSRGALTAIHLCLAIVLVSRATYLVGWFDFLWVTRIGWFGVGLAYAYVVGRHYWRKQR